MEFPMKKEAFIVTQEICTNRRKIPLGSIGFFVEGKTNRGRIVDLKLRPVVALMSNHIKPLTRRQASLLLAIESPLKRYSLVCNEQLFTSICYLQIHDVVRLRYGRMVTVGVVRSFWKQRRKSGGGDLKIVLIEVDLLDPGIFAFGSHHSRLKVDASKIIAVSSSVTSVTSSLWHGEFDERSYERGHLAEDVLETAWEREVLQKMEGVMKGIQGHCNSCYLDTTLYSLFSFSSALDDVLFSSEVHDVTAQQILREQIVQPLRQYGFVGAENVMNLRKLLRCDSFITEEKDPEEFLSVLLGDVLAVEPLLKIRSDNEVLGYNCYQVFAEKDDAVKVPTVQQLLEKSLLSYGLKFDEVPSCLILQMPRFGRNYKKFSLVYPSLELDLTNLMDEAYQVCSICGNQAASRCSSCHLHHLLHPKQHLKQMKLFKNISKALSHRIQLKNSSEELKLSPLSTKQHVLRLDLFAVLCIESSHYVAFVKYGPSAQSWVFFDSMAGTFQHEKGISVPVVKACPQIGHYLAMTPEEFAAVDTKQMDTFSRRFFCDAYTFLYQKPRHSLCRHHLRS